jgi:hypothetical protein
VDRGALELDDILGEDAPRLTPAVVSGNFPGYTQFAATSKDGRRSVVVTVNQAHAGEPTPVFQRVLETYELAACFALSGRG